MSLRKQIKANARRALGGNWGKAICLLLISLTVFVMFSLLQGTVALFAGIPDFQDAFATPGYYLDDVLNLSLASILLSAAFTAASLVINEPLSLGVRQWYYRLSGGDSEDVTTIFGFFEGARPFGKALWLGISRSVRLIGWGLLLGIPPAGILFASSYLLKHAEPGDFSGLAGAILLILGIFLAVLALVLFFLVRNRYFLSSYLLAEDPSLRVRDAIRSSVRFMKGKLGETFLFQLSFLPWLLLCAFVLPALFVFPYCRASLALYARYRIERGRQGQDPVAPEPPVPSAPPEPTWEPVGREDFCEAEPKGETTAP